MLDARVLSGNDELGLSRKKYPGLLVLTVIVDEGHVFRVFEITQLDFPDIRDKAADDSSHDKTNR